MDCATVADSTVALTSPGLRLPRLPGEILNIIFEMTAPTTTKYIALHASTTVKKAIAFHPRQPALASTCRKLRDEFPLQRYYGENRFLITESMFLPGRLEEFFRGRPFAKQYIRHVRVDSIGIPWVDPQSRKLFLCAQSRIRFDVTLADDGTLSISPLKTRVCCCWITSISERAAGPKQIEGRVAAFLVEYASKVQGRYAESGQSCPDCGLAKTGSDSEDQNARVVIIYVMALFMVVFGFMTFTA